MRNISRHQVLPPFEMPVPPAIVPHIAGMTAIEISDAVAGYVRFLSFRSRIIPTNIGDGHE